MKDFLWAALGIATSLGLAVGCSGDGASAAADALPGDVATSDTPTDTEAADATAAPTDATADDTAAAEVTDVPATDDADAADGPSDVDTAVADPDTQDVAIDVDAPPTVCASDFGCVSPGTPHCNGVNGGAGVCVTATGCATDDAREPDDGPYAATAIVPSILVDASICPGPDYSEADYFVFETQVTKTLSAAILSPATSDLFLVRFFDAFGRTYLDTDPELPDGPPSEVTWPRAPPGTYFVQVSVYFPADADQTAAVSYQLVVFAETPECGTDDDCDAPEAPLCDILTGRCQRCLDAFDCEADAPHCQPALNTVERYQCVAHDDCQDDDAVESADDGPSGATPVALGDTVVAHACSDGWEDDWYVIDLPIGDQMDVAMDAPDFSPYLALYDAEGELQDYALGPSQLTLVPVHLSAGRYYLEASNYNSWGREPTLALPYTLTVTRR